MPDHLKPRKAAEEEAMRIRVLPLPEERADDLVVTPYGVVFDMLSRPDEQAIADQAASLRDTMGARFIICSSQPVELDGLRVDVDFDELRETLRETLGARGIKVA